MTRFIERAGAVKTILKTMRNYVINFFTCEHCKRHFEEATRDMDAIKDNKEGLLYLWVSFGQLTGLNSLHFTLEKT